MDRRLRFIAGCSIWFSVASPGTADVILACTYPTLPPSVMRFPDDPGLQKTMEVGARPPVELVEGQGSNRLITANVDGYTFRFAPANSVMDVEADGGVIVSETGRCVTIGGPVSDGPLEIIPTAPAMAGSEPAVEEPSSDAAGSAEKGHWALTEDKSALDDSRTVVLSINSEEPIRGQFGPPGPAVMYLRCMENSTVLYLWLNDLFLSDIQGFGSVDYRIDDGKAASLRMEGSTDNKALGLWNGGASIPVIKKLIDGKRVVFRATPFNESPVEFSFDLSGLDAAIAPLKEACSW